MLYLYPIVSMVFLSNTKSTSLYYIYSATPMTVDR